MTTDIAIVACVEPGPLERQALLLFESIRRFGGATIGDASLHAFSPRGRGIPHVTRRALDALSVAVHTRDLNTTALSYGPANRVYAGAWAEANIVVDLVCVLDSDTVFLGEPVALLLADSSAIAARPVDTTGTCSLGAGHEFEPYWRQLCDLAGITPDAIGWVDTTCDGSRVRSSYNGGLIVCRPSAGVLRRAAGLFTQTVELGLTPRTGSADFRTGVGPVDPDASRWWGSSQAIVSVAAAALGHRISTLPDSYNVPLHLLDRMVRPPSSCVHGHYHWMWEELVPSGGVGRGLIDADVDALAWLTDALDRLRHYGTA